MCSKDLSETRKVGLCMRNCAVRSAREKVAYKFSQALAEEPKNLTDDAIAELYVTKFSTIYCISI